MSKKILTTLIFFIIIIGIAAFLLSYFVFYDKYKMPKGAEIKISDQAIEVFESANLYDLILDNNVEILSENEKLYFNTVGEHGYTIKYKYNNSFRTYLFDVKYKVIDTVAPIFIVSPASSKTFFITEGSNEDLTKKVTYADNYDIKPTLEIEGKVDFSTLGTYEISYVLKDSSNNRVAKKATITIKERPSKIASSEKEPEIEKNPDEEEDNTIHFEDQVKNYKKYGTMVGIDISKWQGKVDFEKVKEDGVEFVILRMGVMKDKTTPLALDQTFQENYENAKKAGLKVGVYIYSESNNVQSAVENAKFVIDNLKGEKLDFPVAFDWESWTYFNDMEMNLHMLNEMYDAFSSTLKEAGYDSMLYGSQSYLNSTWLTLKDYTIWVARYSEKQPELTSNNKFILWQNANTGTVNGIEGNVDLDIYYK